MTTFLDYDAEDDDMDMSLLLFNDDRREEPEKRQCAGKSHVDADTNAATTK